MTTTEKTVNEAVLVAEYTALNTDIQRRLSDRFYLAFGALTVAATLIGVSGIPGYVLLIYPWACWLVSLWLLHNEISIKRKALFMRKIEAAYVPGFSFLCAKPTTGALNTDDLNIETIINRIMVGCEAGVSVIAVLRVFTDQRDLLTFILAGALFLAALAAVALTLRNDYTAREKRLAKKQP